MLNLLIGQTGLLVKVALGGASLQNKLLTVPQLANFIVDGSNCI